MKEHPVDQTADAQVDIHVFGAVIAILEGGCLRSPKSDPTAQQIIRLCKRQQHKLLDIYDAARAKAKDES